MPGISRVERRRRNPYVVIDRRPVEDLRLGWAARGLLGYLLAKPDDWQLRVSDLCRRGDLGRDGIRRVLHQLQDFGYVRREQVRDARGRVVGLDYTVLEVPESPGPDLPGPADPPLLSNKKTKYPITGTRQLLICLPTIEDVAAVQLKSGALAALREAHNFASLRVFCLGGYRPLGDCFGRHFYAGMHGVNEDPFTGSSAGSMGTYLWHHNLF